MTEMRQTFAQTTAVTKREIFTLAGSAAAWVFLVIFLVAAGFLTFMVSDLLSTEQADLTPFFNWLPWLFLFVIPALAMPLWSEERRTGTLDLTLSYPVSMPQLVFGKYLAGLVFVVIALFFTLGIPITVACCGSPDWNAVLCSYFGAVMAGSVFLAVSCFCSALTKSQTAAFLLSLFLCSILLLCGWDRISVYLAMYLPSSLCHGIEYFAVLPHYQAFQRGLIDTSEIAYCVLTTFLFLYLTVRALTFSTSGVGGIFLPGALADGYTWRHLGRLIAGIAFSLYIYLCLIYAADVFSVRFDTTADKAYSITEQTKEIASSLEKNVEIRFYLSESKSEVTRPMLQYGKRIEWLLRDLAKCSNGKIQLTVIHPEQDSPQEEAAQMDGMTPVSNAQSGDRFYLGIAISAGQKNISMGQLSQTNEMILEYEIVRNLLAIQRDKRPLIGVMSPFPIMDTPSEGTNMRGTRALSFFGDLQRDYEIINIPLDTANIPDKVDQDKLEAVIVLQPAGIEPKAVYALDQYLMRGGKLLVFLDPSLLNRKANPSPQELLEAKQRAHAALPALTDKWGIKFDEGMKAADMNFKFTQGHQNGPQKAYPDILRINAEGISRTSPVTATLTSLLMIYPGAFLIDKPQKGLDYEVLVHTTRHSALFPENLEPQKIFISLSRMDINQGKELPLVVSVSGQFKSAFQAKDAVVREVNATGHKTVSTGTPHVILIADADMIMRDTNYRTDTNGQRFYISENITLIQNALEALCGSETFAKLRTRKALSRPLTKVTESRKKVQIQFSEQYLALLRNYELRRRQMSVINSRVIASGGNYKLTEEERIIQREFYRAEMDFRREEKHIRNELNAGLTAINTQARVVNIIIIPFGIICIAIAWFALRAVVQRKSNSSKEHREGGAV